MTQYEDNAGGSAGQALTQGAAGGDGQGESAKTILLPADFEGADSLMPGDTLKVLGKDKDGRCEVEVQSADEADAEDKAPEGKPMMTDLEDSLK